ncbi:GNAT family N-acetyltransferase [Lactococcus nasutitermitis]|uniref:GNAT family N-acetyltransferase n=1 Tax=Lactococcus nasutitermitis TaxID=1652957 RepID=A0ABV9JD99_9LACT|nr:GNAT family N-acetyltransferase [Lactococcus nasutitermitis]
MEIKITRDTMSDIYFDALKIRNQVFVKEQGVPYELEVGNSVEEASSVHFVLYDDGKARGTVRLLADMNKHSALVQRMAVFAEDRHKGYAKSLFNELLLFSEKSYFTTLTLHAQLSARGFYAQFGFEEVGEIFEEAGIQHIGMEKKFN